jgi:predicted RNA-binding Zn-ribbon protein involved in translation (DUF1610 family)
MSQITDQFGAAVADIVGHPIVQMAAQGIVIYAVALWLAAAFWAFRDMRCRTVNPLAPYLAAGGVILFSPLLFPLAVLAYRIVRPQETISEAWERHLAEEAMRAELDATTCAGCGRRVDEEWLACPTCGTRLSRRCVECGKAVALDWSLCAWCGRDFGRLVVEPVESDMLSASPQRALARRGDLEVMPPAPETRVEPRPAAIPIFGGRGERRGGLFERRDRRDRRDREAEPERDAAAADRA